MMPEDAESQVQRCHLSAPDCVLRYPGHRRLPSRHVLARMGANETEQRSTRRR